MQVIKNVNGITYKFVNTLFTFKMWYCFNLYNEKRKLFLFQFNRFENGYCCIYLRLFKKYSFNITDIKVSEGKRVFFGNREN